MPSSSTTTHFSPLEIWRARARLKGLVLHTPLVFSPMLSRRTGCQVFLKMECWQTCGCFKVRGAINMVSALDEADRRRGLVTTSSGNHGIAVAYAASLHGRPPTTVFLPEDADPTKVRLLEQWDPELVFRGQTYLEAYDEAQQFLQERGGVYVHSHAHPLIIAGQGTIGLEIMADLPEVDVVLVPIGGGGLVSGIATALRSISDTVKIVGVEPTAAPAAYLSFRDGVCHDQIDVKPSIADGLLGGFGQLPFEICRHLVEEVVLVEDEEIVAGMRAFQEDERLMVEAASAVGLAAILSGKVDLHGQKVVLVVTSRNVDAQKYNQLVGGKRACGQ